MILEITIAGEINYIDTDIILYAYDDSGLKIVVASEGVRNNPTLEIFTNANAQTVTLPTYANFVLATAGARFIEMSSVTWGDICVNIDRIAKLAEIDASNTTVLFDKYNVVDTDTAMATLITAINDASGSVIPIPPITGSTKTKITYNSAGQVTAGADATTADIADSTNRRYVTDAQQTVIGNTSGTNSGDNATNTQYSGLAASKQDTLVSGTNIKTVNSNSLVGAGNVVIAETAASIGAIVNGATNYTTPLDADKIGIWDALNSLFKAVTWANLKATLKTYFDTFYATIANLALKAPLASPTFTGNVAAPNLNTGVTLNGTVFAKSTNAVTLASSNHATTIGNEATGVNMALGLYSTGVGIQGRNNSAVAALNINPLGGDVRFGLNAPAGAMQIIGTHTGSGTGDYCTFELRNGGGAVADAIFMRIIGTAATLSGINKQDYGVIGAGTNIAGLAIGTQGNAPVELWTNNAHRYNILGNGNFVSIGNWGMGYATGSGGTVTQATSKATGVTLSKLSGEITLNNAALAAGTIVSFTLTNTLLTATDVLVLNHVTTGTLGAYTLNAQCNAGSATITIRNNTAGSLSEAIVIRFATIKGSTN